MRRVFRQNHQDAPLWWIRESLATYEAVCSRPKGRGYG
jgi:hypothetical protein